MRACASAGGGVSGFTRARLRCVGGVSGFMRACASAGSGASGFTGSECWWLVVTGGAFVGCVGGLVVTGGAFVGGFWAKLRCFVSSVVPVVSCGFGCALAVASPVSCGAERALAVVSVVLMLSPWFFWVSII